MGTEKGTDDASSERRNWKKVLNACVEMLQTQQIQIECLVKERKFLEDRMKTQYDHWGSHVRVLEDQMSQMKSEIMMEKLERSIVAAESDLKTSSKEREASMYKLKLDHAEGEIENAKKFMDCVIEKISDPKDLSGGNTLGKDREKGGRDSVRKSAKSTKEEEQRSKILDIEVRRLKQEYEKLSLQKSAEVAALLLEKDFVWNQYKTIESDYTNKLKSKHVEVERASEKIEKLLASMEQLQSLNSEKDVAMVTLKTNLAKLEGDANRRNDEISRLTQELELLRKARSASVTPVLKRCIVKPTGLGGMNNGGDRSNVVVKKEPHASRVPDLAKNSEKGARSLRRKRNDIIHIPDTPKLFSSSFTVPKLKRSSPLVR